MRHYENYCTTKTKRPYSANQGCSKIELDRADSILRAKEADTELSSLARELAEGVFFKLSDDFQDFFRARRQRIGIKAEERGRKHTIFLDSGKLGGSTLICLASPLLQQCCTEFGTTKLEAVAEAMAAHYAKALVKVFNLARDLMTELPEHSMSETEFEHFVISAVHSEVIKLAQTQLQDAS